MWIKNIFIFLIICCSSALSYKILMVCAPPSRSHYNLCSAVTNTLTERNHEVTFITAFGADNPKYREMLVDMSDVFPNMPSIVSMNDMSAINAFRFLIKFTPLVTKAIFKTPSVINMLNDKSEKFDLIILEYFVNQNLLGFSVKYNCPAIALTSLDMMPYVALSSGNPLSPATVPVFVTSLPLKMNLWERTYNTALTLMQFVVEAFEFKPLLENEYLKYFPEESKLVPFNELHHKISAVLSNTHYSIGVARPFLPNVAEIAGYHIRDPAPLPENLQKIMDSAKDGVVFFSMGSVLPTVQIDSDFKKSLINSFSKFKQTILMKFDEDIKDLPKNIIIQKWLPQSSILAHPNIKLFITHGGFLSLTEATHFEVPILMIPVFGDQSHNAKLCTERGQGLTVDFKNLDEPSLTSAMREMLNNPKYAEITKNISRLYHDRPMKPRDLLSYQVEHVIRTGGASHMSPPYLPRYSLLLLDVIAIILIPVLVVICLLRCLLKKICKKSTGKIKTK